MTMGGESGLGAELWQMLGRREQTRTVPGSATRCSGFSLDVLGFHGSKHWLTFVKHWLCAASFTDVTSLTHHSSPFRMGLLLTPSYKWETEAQGGSDLPQNPQLGGGPRSHPGWPNCAV